jgi:hypothetical protein
MDSDEKLGSLMAMHISQAYLCSDCNFIGNRSESCVKCASVSVMLLQPILDKKEETVVEYSASLEEELRNSDLQLTEEQIQHALKHGHNVAHIRWAQFH